MGHRAARGEGPRFWGVEGLLIRLRLRGMLPDTDPALSERIVAAGHARRRGDRLVLTPEGRGVADSLARYPAGSEAEGRCRRAYEGFLPLNAELLRLGHDWQVRGGGVPNDHSDRAYDWGVIDRLARLHERAGPVIGGLGRHLDRFAGYRPALRDALGRLKAGEHDWFTSPRVDSYHTVWMLLHEDLLLALGIERSSEGTGAGGTAVEGPAVEGTP